MYKILSLESLPVEFSKFMSMALFFDFDQYKKFVRYLIEAKLGNKRLRMGPDFSNTLYCKSAYSPPCELIHCAQPHSIY